MQEISKADLVVAIGLLEPSLNAGGFQHSLYRLDVETLKALKKALEEKTAFKGRLDSLESFERSLTEVHKVEVKAGDEVLPV